MDEKLKKALYKKAREKAHFEEKYGEIPIDKLEENPYQPRIEINQKELKELADSIKQNGLLQPILVQKIDKRYVIISGHRRVEAHKLLNKKFIKAIVVKNQQNSELVKKSIIENLQRKDLNIIETAIALKRYKEEFNKTLEEIGKEIGKDKGFVSKLLNILNLPEKVIQDVKQHRTTQDVRALAMLNTYANKIKKLDMPNFSKKYPEIDIKKLENEIFNLYQDFLKNGREWLKKEIKKRLGLKENEKNKRLIKIKTSKENGTTIKINRNISSDKLEDLKKDLEELIQKYL
jgi:ParB family chromosome partitioning protein